MQRTRQTAFRNGTEGRLSGLKPRHCFAPEKGAIQFAEVRYAYHRHGRADLLGENLDGPRRAFASACAGAIYKVPLASLSDSRQPWQRAADIQVLSPKPPGEPVEEILGMVFNPSNPTENYMYAADAMRLRLIRINTITGKREVLADDHELFNFPSSLAFMPPLAHEEIFPQLVVVSNQQHLTPITNDAAPQDNFEFPFIATRVVLKPNLH